MTSKRSPFRLPLAAGATLVATLLLVPPGAGAAQALEAEALPEAPRVACYLEAQRAGILTEHNAQQLCTAAESPAPAQCYELVRERSFITETDALELCRFAQTLAPAECYLQAREETFLEPHGIVQLCKPVLPLLLPPRTPY